MVHVLFVCLGNICRSPMAEAMMRDLIQKEALEDQILVDSAATSSWHIGKPPHAGTLAKLDEYGISSPSTRIRHLICVLGNRPTIQVARNCRRWQSETKPF